MTEGRLSKCVFAEHGYIEQWGSGVRRMTNLCAEAGLPRPSIEERPGRVRVTFRMDRTSEAQLNQGGNKR